MGDHVAVFEEGQRIGRFVLMHDVEGTLHAVSATAVIAACETDAGAVLLLPGGRMIQVTQSLHTLLSWLEMGGR
ncbi:hypothetical protein [Roseomonas elaeocarpi]|uniref:Uncharacterized protein n=1 Tax=Roseomonas elaeocarpi TaxID=907779 RepID=A0ABV6JND5_9PROT